MNPYVIHRDGDITLRSERRFLGFVDHRHSTPTQPKRWIAECYIHNFSLSCLAQFTATTRREATRQLWKHVEEAHS